MSYNYCTKTDSQLSTQPSKQTLHFLKKKLLSPLLPFVSKCIKVLEELPKHQLKWIKIKKLIESEFILSIDKILWIKRAVLELQLKIVIPKKEPSILDIPNNLAETGEMLQGAQSDLTRNETDLVAQLDQTKCRSLKLDKKAERSLSLEFYQDSPTIAPDIGLTKLNEALKPSTNFHLDPLTKFRETISNTDPADKIAKRKLIQQIHEIVGSHENFEKILKVIQDDLSETKGLAIKQEVKPTPKQTPMPEKNHLKPNTDRRTTASKPQIVKISSEKESKKRSKVEIKNELSRLHADIKEMGYYGNEILNLKGPRKCTKEKHYFPELESDSEITESPKPKKRKLTIEDFKKPILKLKIKTVNGKPQVSFPQFTNPEEESNQNDPQSELQTVPSSKIVQSVRTISQSFILTLGRNGLLYACRHCSKETMQKQIFVDHIKREHISLKWTKYCSTCEVVVKDCGDTIEDEFNHMMLSHIQNEENSSKKVIEGIESEKSSQEKPAKKLMVTNPNPSRRGRPSRLFSTCKP